MEEQRFFPGSYSCPLCGAALTPIGPLWTGSIQDSDLLNAMIQDAETFEAGDPAGLSRTSATCRDETVYSFSYDYHKLAKFYRLSPGPVHILPRTITEQGIALDGALYRYGVKTDAPLCEIIEVLKNYNLYVLSLTLSLRFLKRVLRWISVR
jgi:tRNA (guanine26-N2/guanine27-N2)-dimethyltransferase